MDETVDDTDNDAPPDTAAHPGPDTAAVAGVVPASDPVDLDAIDADLDGVDAALRRLDDGSYWTDELTGDPLDEELLAADPIARRARI